MSHSEQTDRPNLDRLIRGDNTAWTELVRRHLPVVRAMVRRTLQSRMPNLQDAEINDIANDVFLRLVQNDYHTLKTYDPSKASFSTWISVISRGVALNAIRRKKLPQVPLDAVSEVDAPLQRDHEKPVTLPTRLLSERQEQILRLTFDAGLSPDEIAGQLGINVQTVRSMKHKALTRLREHFRDE